MVSGDCQTRIKRRVKEDLQNLDFVRKDSDSDIVETLISFYKSHKSLFDKWRMKKQKKKN